MSSMAGGEEDDHEDISTGDPLSDPPKALDPADPRGPNIVLPEKRREGRPPVDPRGPGGIPGTYEEIVDALTNPEMIPDVGMPPALDPRRNGHQTPPPPGIPDHVPALYAPRNLRGPRPPRVPVEGVMPGEPVLARAATRVGYGRLANWRVQTRQLPGLIPPRSRVGTFDPGNFGAVQARMAVSEMATARAMRGALEYRGAGHESVQGKYPSRRRLAGAAAIAGGASAAIYGVRRGGGGGGFMFNQAAEMRRLVAQLSR